MSSDFYEKYFPVYDQFRQAVDNTAPNIVSIPMRRAAEILSDTPLSRNFYDTVKGVEAGRIYPEGTDHAKREFLKEQAGVALLNCGLWHQPHRR